MRNEMDLLGMSESQRWNWLLANRLTLIFVGLVWLGMIVERLMRGETPWFLIGMVPVFALFRLAAYVYFRRHARGGAR